MAVREPMTGTMQSLVYDKSSMPWDKSRGFALKDMPLPVLDEALEALKADQEFLMKGDVFTQDAIDMWIDYKTENEVNDIKLRPHPHEFYLYYDI